MWHYKMLSVYISPEFCNIHIGNEYKYQCRKLGNTANKVVYKKHPVLKMMFHIYIHVFYILRTAWFASEVILHFQK